MESIDFSKLDKVFIIAELSANHNGRLETAIETIRAAKRAGADAIKLQTYTADSMTINSSKINFTINNGSIWDGKSFYELYQEAHTPWEWHPRLFEVAKEEGLICFSSPFDKKSVDFLHNLKVPCYKIASFEITDIPLIEYVASKGKPIILSTGIARFEDIELALKTIRSISDIQIVLLKCTSSYPTPLEEANLAMIPEFENYFGVIPGLSDHTLGSTAPIVATCLGAKIIEKHFILDRSIGGPDASFSLDEKEFTQLVKDIRSAEVAIGKVGYTLSKNQEKARDFSRSLFIIKDVDDGEIIDHTNVRSLRPNAGIAPKNLPLILGKKFKGTYTKGTPLQEKMFYD